RSRSMLSHTSAARIAVPATLALATLCCAGALPAQEPSGTLTIGGAARAAAERSALVQVGRERAAQATTRVRQRRADLLPTISAIASEGERTLNSAGFGLSLANPANGQPLLDPNGQVLGPVRGYDLRASVRQALADPAALARVAAARATADALDREADAIAQQAAAGAALAAVVAMRAEALLSARISDSALAVSLVDLARAQSTAGIGIALDVTRAESQAALARAQVIAARNGLARARLELARSMGLAATAPFALANLIGAPSPAAPEPVVDAAVQVALARRADLRAVSAQIGAAERQVRAVHAERLPTVAAFADDGAAGRSTNHLLNTWSWGIQVGVPIFDGFRREARLAEQRSVTREIDLRRRELAAQAETDVRAAILDIGSAAEQLLAARERERLATQEVAQARDRFSAGVSGNADVIVASQNLNAARTFLIESESALLAARVHLARAQGTVTDLP
ncbi:MAG: TolC family protein, partial [Gemmatimonadota bacterium]|nr:TolC family protein [Gemmatimonadota bacterium]